MARVIGNRAMNRTVARLSTTQKALERKANSIGNVAEGLLQPHRKTGEHHIVVEKNRDVKYGHIDYEVQMRGPAAESVEFGHTDSKSGRPVAGLHIIARAAGLLD
jgi:hypothetical protein